MAVSNTLAGGTDFVDGTTIEVVDVNDTFDAMGVKGIFQDQTGGTIDNSTTETEIGEVEVPANRVKNGIVIIVSGKVASTGTANGCSIRLYGGTSATATENTLLKTVTRSAVNTQCPFSIVIYVTTLTWTSLNYINITGENGAAAAGKLITCESIVVIPL